MYHQDWLMRQIEMTAKFIAKFIFGKTSELYIPYYVEDNKEIDVLYTELERLLNEGHINAAENLLFEKANPIDIRYLELAVDFYSRLNRLTDEELEAAFFSREEVEDGLSQFAQRYNIETF
jgi:hypothetical protein